MRRSIRSPTETKIFTGEGLLYSIPVNDDRRGSLRVSKILRAALPIAFIVVVYTGEPMGILFGRNVFSLIPPLAWFFLLVALGECSQRIQACAYGEGAPPIFLGSHPQGVLPANIPGEPLCCCDDGTTAVFQP